MRIHGVTIENFRGIEKRDISFCEPGTDTPRRLSVVVGPNMCGKTTVLDALHLVYEVVANLNAPKLRQEFNPNDPALRPDPHQPIRIKVRFSLQPGELEVIRDLEHALGDPDAPPSDVYEIRLRWPPKEGVQGMRSVLDRAEPLGANFALRGRSLAKIVKAKGLRPGGHLRSGGWFALPRPAPQRVTRRAQHAHGARGRAARGRAAAICCRGSNSSPGSTKNGTQPCRG